MGNTCGPPVYVNRDIIIAVIGPTGAGKSSFITMATGVNVPVGKGLAPCTTQITSVKSPFLEGVVFVDTPGFDSSQENKSETDILNMIDKWLKKTYKSDIVLAGILYLHQISANRATGISSHNPKNWMFKQLCGENASRNIILTTTMWDEVEEDTGLKREKELEDNYWKAMIKGGSTTARFRNTTASAWGIVDPLIQRAYEPCAERLQKKMVDMKKRVRKPDSDADQKFHTLENVVQKRQETLRKIRDELKRPDSLVALSVEHEVLTKQLEDLITDMKW